MSSKKKTAKKKRPVPREGIDRPRNGGQWSEARFTTFIKNALRSAAKRWGPKFACIKACYVEDGINPATGHKCKLHRCPQCNGLFPQGEIFADHITAVVGPEGFVDWNTFIERLFSEKEGYDACCRQCHLRRSLHENQVRKNNKEIASRTNSELNPPDET